MTQSWPARDISFVRWYRKSSFRGKPRTVLLRYRITYLIYRTVCIFSTAPGGAKKLLVEIRGQVIVEYKVHHVGRTVRFSAPVNDVDYVRVFILNMRVRIRYIPLSTHLGGAGGTCTVDSY
jgi:hypothetical protein